MTIPGTFSSMSMASTASGAITYVGSSGRLAAANGLVTSAHANTQTGDFVFLVGSCNETNTLATPSGWTSLFNYTGSDHRLFGFWRTYAGSMPTLTTSATNYIVAAALTFRGVHATPLDASVATDTAPTFVEFTPSFDAVFDLDGITTVSANALVFWIIGHGADNSSSLMDSFVNANISEGQEFADYSTATSDGGGFAVWGGYKVSPGATGTTRSTGISPASSTVMAIKPA